MEMSTCLMFGVICANNDSIIPTGQDENSATYQLECACEWATVLQ